MPLKTEPRAWIVCPCSQDAHFNAATAQFILSPVPQVTPAGLQVRLPRKPPVGMLLTVEFVRGPRIFSAPIVARVTAVKQEPEGWLARCEWLAPLTEDGLQTMLAASTG